MTNEFPIIESLRGICSYARWNMEAATRSHIQHMSDICSALNLEKEFMTLGINVLPALADINPSCGSHLFVNMLKLCKGNKEMERQVWGSAFDVMTKTDGLLFNVWLVDVADDLNISVEEFASCAGRLPDGTGLILSAPGGSGGRVSLAMRLKQTSRAITVFKAGCFMGGQRQLLKQSREAHGPGTKHNKHYRDFVAQANEAFDFPIKLPDFGAVMQVKITAARANPA